MNWKRRIHDLNAAFRNGVSEEKCLREVPEAHLLERRSFQEGGTVSFENDLERGFHDDAPPETGYRYPSADYYHLRDVLLTTTEGSLFLPDKRHLQLCGVCRRIPLRKVRPPLPVLARRVREPLLHLCGPNYENHGHFILDFLPKLVGAAPILKENPKMKLLLPEGQSRWQMNYLKRFGITEERIFQKDAGTLYVEDLWYAPIPNADGHLGDPQIHRNVRDALESDRIAERTPRPLFIPRLADAPNKRVTNEDGLIAVAREYFPDLTVMSLSRTPLEEQMAAFRVAPFVIGAVGQGLADILFARNAMMLVLTFEAHLKKTRSWSKAYCHLARVSGNQGLALTTGADRDRLGDFEVPEARFRQGLEYLIRRRPEFFPSPSA